MRRRVASPLVAALLPLVLGGALRVGSPAGAQEATPAATPAAFPVVAAPEECRVEPRSLASLQAIATPASGPATPSPAAGADGLPAGEPADAETVAGVTATTRELVACVNGGELLRGFALFSDAFLRFEAGSEPIEQTLYDSLATRQPRPPEARIALVAVEGVRLLPDGRAGALVTVDPPGPGEDSEFLIFVRSGDRWLLDGSIAQVPGEATPVP